MEKNDSFMILKQSSTKMSKWYTKYYISSSIEFGFKYIGTYLSAIAKV